MKEPLSSALRCWGVRSAMVTWPNKSGYNGVLEQQTHEMVHCLKDLKHISVLQLNWSIRNTAEHAYWCLPRRRGGGVEKAVYLHTSSSPAVTPLIIWIIPDKPLFEITGLQIKLGHPCKNKQIHGSRKKSIFLSSLPGSWEGSFFSWDPPVELKKWESVCGSFLILSLAVMSYSVAYWFREPNLSMHDGKILSALKKSKQTTCGLNAV